MEQGAPMRDDATERGHEAEMPTSRAHARDFREMENAAKMPFEVWQLQRYYRPHIILCSIFFCVGLLAMCIMQEVHANLLGSTIVAAMLGVIRHAVQSATDQLLAQQAFEYSAFAMIVIRLVVGYCAIPEGSIEPLEICLQVYGWDILRPIAFAMFASTLAMRPFFMVILLFMYAVRLTITAQTLMLANNLDGTKDSLTSGWNLYPVSMLPITVFLVSLLTYTMRICQSRSLHTHMAQLQKALNQEMLANEHAIRCEQRAHEAEKHVYEERLQQRNKYLGAMCHDFGTPVAVLQTLLLMMRKRMLRDRERERREAKTAAMTTDHGMPKVDTDGCRCLGGGKAPYSLVSGASVGASSSAISSATCRANSSADSLELCEDSARMLDLIRRASAGLELLEVTRQKAIAFSKLQAGGSLVPDCKAFEVAELLRKSASIARDTGKSDRTLVQTHVSGDLPLVVNSDGNWLFMILVNFASNSMKHTRQGSVTIRATRVGRLRLRFEVSDTGSGVPAEFVPSLFQPFSSASTTATSVESTGLGLYHSKQLAEILGGEVGYEPNAGGGAVFYVEVPMALVAADKAEETLAKNRVEFAGLEVPGAVSEQGARRGQHRNSVIRAGKGKSVSCAPFIAPAAAVAAPTVQQSPLSSNVGATAEAAATTVQRSRLTGDAAAMVDQHSSDSADCVFDTASCAARRIKLGAHFGINAAASASHGRSFAASSALPPLPLPSPSPSPLPLSVPSPSQPPPQPQPQPQPQLSVQPESVPPSRPSPPSPQEAKALTALPASHQFLPSAPLKSLFSRVPPPLITDDSELARNVMREQLRAWAGVVPMEAEDGLEALRVLTSKQRQIRPSVLLLAVHMAELNGHETCRAIRAWEQSRGVADSERLRIVGLLTFSNDAAGRAACLDAEMDDAIVKPFDAATLHSTLCKLLC